MKESCNKTFSVGNQLSARGALLRTGIFYIKSSKTRTMMFNSLGRIQRLSTHLQAGKTQR